MDSAKTRLVLGFFFFIGATAQWKAAWNCCNVLCPVSPRVATNYQAGAAVSCVLGKFVFQKKYLNKNRLDSHLKNPPRSCQLLYIPSQIHLQLDRKLCHWPLSNSGCLSCWLLCSGASCKCCTLRLRRGLFHDSGFQKWALAKILRLCTVRGQRTTRKMTTIIRLRL